MPKQLYDRPIRYLMREYAAENLKPGQVFSKTDPVSWFSKHYPKVKPITVQMHVDGMSVNSLSRKHAPHIGPGLDWDLFFKMPDGRFRLWDETSDPQPKYKNEIISGGSAVVAEPHQSGETEDRIEEKSEEASKFAYEHHLRDYLARNLASIEPGLRLYEDEGFNGVEFPVGGRFIDVLAVAANGDFVVIELKVSRGYDRTIGQVLRYMAWIQENLGAEKKVRGVIVANEITEDLRLAASRIPDVSLVEYELSFALKPVVKSKSR